MSQKRKIQRAKHEAQERKKAEKVINWIIGVLVVLALVLIIVMGFRYA